MGKLRIKTLGDEEKEQEQKKKTEKKREAKKAAEKAAITSVESATVIAIRPEPEKQSASEDKGPRNDETKSKKTKKKKFQKNQQTRSKKYNEARIKVDRTKKYSLKEALQLLPQVHIAKFDESVELHINTEETGINGAVQLPHGTGKKLRVAIANDQILAEIEKGKINFDVLLSHPAMMPKLAKVAKILGPRGLMPNPKNGTITSDPEKTALQFEGGHMNYKTEPKTPIMHLMIGKLSFGPEKLEENIKIVFASLRNAKAKQVVLKSTMSPGIKLDF